MQKNKLSEDYILPPFSCMNSRDGQWQKRKKAWIEWGGFDTDETRDSLVYDPTTSNKEGYQKVCQVGSLLEFDPVLAELLYRWFVPQNGKILDMFAGGPVRGLVASYLGFDYTGIELRQKQVHLNDMKAHKLSLSPKYIIGDSLTVLPSMDIMFDNLTCCYDDKTELLTKNGFKFFSELTKKDLVATLDEKGYLIYQQPIAIQINDFNGNLINFSNHRGFDICVTPDHNLLLKKRIRRIRYEKEYKLIKAIEAKKLDKIKTACLWKGRNQKYFVLPSIINDRGIIKKSIKIKMEDWMTFFGWYITEGWCYHSSKIKIGSAYEVLISQKDVRVLEDIKVMMSKYGFNGSIKLDTNKRAFTLKFINRQLYEYLKPLGKSIYKYIPKKFLNLSPYYLKFLFESMIKGDGNGRNCYYTSSKQLANDFMELIIKLGKFSRLYVQEKNLLNKYKATIAGKEVISRHPKYTIILNNSKEQTIRNIKEISYNGKTYCCSIPNQKLLIRRNGRTSWCGNCPPYFNLEKYSDEDADLSNKSTYEEFLDTYFKIIKLACDKLKDNRFACFVVTNIRDKQGFYRNLVGDTVEGFRQAGLHFYNDAILLNMVGSVSLRVNKSFGWYRKLGRVHQNILVFYKGNDCKDIKQDFTILKNDIPTNQKSLF